MADKKENKKTILVVEDDKFLIKIYQVKFEKEGFEVMIASDGNEAMAMLYGNKIPDIVLLDLMLPITNGFDVLAAMKKKEKWKNIPVIVLSNLGQDSDIKKAKDMGVTENVVKSNSKINEIVSKVKQYLE